MACTISIANNDESTWMASNALFSAFVEYIKSMSTDDSEAVEEIASSVYNYGLTLDLLEQSNPNLALRVAIIFKSASAHIATGNADLDSDNLLYDKDTLERRREMFHALQTLMTAYIETRS